MARGPQPRARHRRSGGQLGGLEPSPLSIDGRILGSHWRPRKPQQMRLAVERLQERLRAQPACKEIRNVPPEIMDAACLGSKRAL